ncbi:MAG: hypothetical protein ACON5A_01675 [Candidatus Comchoanobacterales bacterium]
MNSTTQHNKIQYSTYFFSKRVPKDVLASLTLMLWVVLAFSLFAMYHFLPFPYFQMSAIFIFSQWLSSLLQLQMNESSLNLGLNAECFVFMGEVMVKNSLYSTFFLSLMGFVYASINEQLFTLGLFYSSPGMFLSVGFMPLFLSFMFPVIMPLSEPLGKKVQYLVADQDLQGRAKSLVCDTESLTNRKETGHNTLHRACSSVG